MTNKIVRGESTDTGLRTDGTRNDGVRNVDERVNRNDLGTVDRLNRTTTEIETERRERISAVNAQVAEDLEVINKEANDAKDRVNDDRNRVVEIK